MAGPRNRQQAITLLILTQLTDTWLFWLVARKEDQVENQFPKN